jgi:general secretion pathway protein B
MSYILDALKKIEHEKRIKAGPNGRVNISGDLFRERAARPGKKAVWKIAALVGVVALIACAGTWFVLQKGNKKSAVLIRPAEPPPVSTPVPVAVPVQQPLPVQPQPVQVPLPAAVSKPPAQAETAEDDAPVRNVRRQNKQGKARQSPPNQQQTVQTVPAPADIKLSGIAWQDDRSARRVVINGFLLKEGAVVSGAKITDIQADRVRFVSPSGQFEIRLDAVFPAEVKK